ncbi:5'/3'-nucleotidase SurE [Aquimarina sp. ERC-38]|uniref:5'/3'-nucleotidase SurE n=1 Tax=Aquimarina sp. ERC-38 TaxID=2949996 RepID=UPI0022478886|nr:5'/3'-nucleotidase SurE [Aquimarina sp. ERC-38]UZO81284.1 5'/3'-nucleotidase SurE [Aquimarina sp. ERC-38]
MEDKEKPLILVTNDDGITAPGIRALIQVASTIGDVVVVAPDSPQSAMGHAITIHNTLYCDPVVIDSHATYQEYSCSGTPVDCVKLATQEIMERKPDLCISGINHGSNSAINVIYSGTMSAAVEAGIEGIPAIGFSLLNYSMKADFKPSKPFVKKIIQEVLHNGLPKGIVLNVNIPDLSKSEIKGIRVARQANARWQENFDKRTNPMGREYYWLTGEFINDDLGEDSDEWALQNGFVSVVPTQFDLTAHQFIDNLNNWNFND